MLNVEYHGIRGFSNLVDRGQVKVNLIKELFSEQSYFMVLERLEVTVTDLFDRNQQYFKKIDILKMGIQLVKNIRGLHDSGWVHLDLKPDNMMFDTPKSNHSSSYSNIMNARVNDQIEGKESVIRKMKQNNEPRPDEQQPLLVASNLSIIDLGTCECYIDVTQHAKKVHLPNIINLNG